jgi:hypothetical protein
LSIIISKFWPQYPTHLVSDGRGDVLDIVFHKDVRLPEVRVLDILDSDHRPIKICIWVHINTRKILVPVEEFRAGAVSKPRLYFSIPDSRNLIHVWKPLKQLAISQPP